MSDTIWDTLSENPVTENSQDTYTLVLGAKGSGKSTVITRFLNPTKEDVPKPTAMLEYCFGRKSVPGSNIKAVSHIWEIAATNRVADMVRIPLKLERVCASRVLIALDMSNPGDAMSLLDQYIKLSKRVITEVLKEKSKNKDGKKSVQALAESTENHAHQDAKFIEPFPVPLLIVLTKYDTFCDEDSLKRKTLAQGIRYVAHVHNASIQCMSTKNRTFISQCKASMNQLLFRSEVKADRETDSAKWISIQAGSDTFEDIGIPRGARREHYEDGSMDEKLSEWQRAVHEFYPPSSNLAKVDQEISFDTMSNICPEPTIDKLRAQKRDDLERYIKAASRNAKLDGKSKRR